MTHETRDAEVVWSGALQRQDEAAYSLCGPGWQVRGTTMLQAAAPERGGYRREVRAANRVPAGDTGRQSRPAGHPQCQTCGRPTLQRRLRCVICQRAHDNQRRRKRSAA